MESTGRFYDLPKHNVSRQVEPAYLPDRRLALVQVKNGALVTDSLMVAEVFEKEHKNVLRDIENLECSQEFRRLNFKPSNYMNSQGKNISCVEMTRDGFTFLAMGFTGSRAAACQMNGLNDPSATRKQRIAAMTCYELLMEAIMTGIESGLGKEQVKQMMNDAINQAAEFFNLGNKKAVAARNKAQRKAA